MAGSIRSYRDTFRLLLCFARKRLRTSPDRLAFEKIDAPFISAFLSEIEKTRGVNGLDSTHHGRPPHARAVNGAAVLDGDPRASLPPLLRTIPGDSGDTSPATRLWRVVVLVLLPFVSGYYLSYLYRTINALISEALVAELSLSPGHLGFLTATYFLAFGLIQLPLGVWLDRFGPRRVQAVLLSFAAGGAALFASAEGFAALAIGRGLIGLGVAGALMPASRPSFFGSWPSVSRSPTAWARWAPSPPWPRPRSCSPTWAGAACSPFLPPRPPSRRWSSCSSCLSARTAPRRAYRPMP
jgi:hypothetical protein